MNFSRNNYFIIRVLSKIEHNKIIQMVVPRWRMLPVSFLVINDVIVTSLLLLKIFCVSQLLDTLLFKCFSFFLSILREIWILTKNSTI